jgi:hypothetical protein
MQKVICGEQKVCFVLFEEIIIFNLVTEECIKRVASNCVISIVKISNEKIACCNRDRFIKIWN